METISVYVPVRTAARLRAHAAATGQTVSELAAAILSSAEKPENQFSEPDGGYNPKTGSY